MIHLPKLLQKPNIVLKHVPDVVDVVHQRGHAFEAEAEGEPGVFLRVDTDGTEHVRVHHSRAAELYPAGAFARAAALAFELAGAVTFEA